MIAKLRERAAALLQEGKVTLVIGHGMASQAGNTMPIFVRNPVDVAKLVWNADCHDNLARYLTRPEIRSVGKVAVTASSATFRAIVMLIVENQIKRENLHILGIRDGQRAPWNYADEVFDAEPTAGIGEDKIAAEVARMRTMTREDRWAFWQKQFSRCLKCYACRQTCPMCYCERCIAEKNLPQWIPTSPHAYGNFFWNIIHAYHLAGRCVGCDECERACPAGIPLSLLNREMAQIARDNFKWEAGLDPKATPPLMNADMKDSIDFIE